ncbi:DUF262 domain-containing protein [bacterium]|nr:DUF262 domain-containing protein [bacterium]
MSIISLMNQIKEGDIVLPAIQRGFVWPEDKVVMLLDSIMQGYPIGITLLWETYEDLQYRDFEKNYKEANKYSFNDNSQRRKLKVVLDGQQRLQSLYIALYGTYEGQYLYFDILSGHDNEDTDNEKYLFVFLKPEEAQKKNKEALEEFVESGQDHGDPTKLPYWIKAQDLFSMTVQDKLSLWKEVCAKLKLSDNDEELIMTNLARFDEALTKDSNILKTSIVDQDLPSESPSRKSESDVLEIFVRINRQGTPLSRSDLIFSMLKLKWRESAEALPEFVDKINEGNSFELDTDFIIRCLYAVSDLGTKFNIDILRKKKNMEAIKSNFSKCCKAVESTIDFVQQHCWCSNTKAIGGSNTLVPFVYYLFNKPDHQVPDREIVNMRKALYIFGFTVPFSRYGDSRVAKFIRKELKPLKEEDYEFPYKDAIWWSAYWSDITELGEQLLQRNPRLALQVIQRQPGGKAHFRSNANEMDHIFPRSILRDKDYDQAEINHFANFWLLSKGKNQNKSNKHPKKYFADVPDSELKRAFIDREMLNYGRYKRFIKQRGEKIKSYVQKTLGFSEEDFQFGSENEDI